MCVAIMVAVDQTAMSWSRCLQSPAASKSAAAPKACALHEFVLQHCSWPPERLDCEYSNAISSLLAVRHLRQVHHRLPGVHCGQLDCQQLMILVTAIMLDAKIS